MDRRHWRISTLSRRLSRAKCRPLQNALIAFAPSGVLAASQSAVSPSLMLALNAHPFFAQTEANSAKFGRGLQQTLTIPGWKRERKQVEFAVGQHPPRKTRLEARADVVGNVPTLVQGDPFPSSGATWVAPGWAVITYSVSSSRVSPRGQLRIGLGSMRNRQNSGVERGLPCALGARVPAFRCGHGEHRRQPWHGPVTLPSPTPSWWFQRVEQASIRESS